MIETTSLPVSEPIEDFASSHGTMFLAMLIWLLWVGLLVLRYNHPQLSIF
jgi:hypothetical protein